MDEAQPRGASSADSVRRGLGLLVVFLLVKLLAVLLRIADGGGHGLLSAFAPIALVYQDVAAAAVFGAIDAGVCTLLRRRTRALRSASVGLRPTPPSTCRSCACSRRRSPARCSVPPGLR
jgi:hypothetical protein